MKYENSTVEIFQNFWIKNSSFQLEKVLQPCEVADACEPYLKEDKNKERLMQTAQQYCERLGAFRMPLGWFAIDLNQILNGSHHSDKTEALAAMIASSATGAFFFYIVFLNYEFPEYDHLADS